MCGSIGNRVLRKRNGTLELAIRERDRTISRMTARIHDLEEVVATMAQTRMVAIRVMNDKVAETS